MPSTPWSIMQSRTRFMPSESTSPLSWNGVGAIGNTPVGTRSDDMAFSWYQFPACPN
jgi:hypothetical protein